MFLGIAYLGHLNVCLQQPMAISHLVPLFFPSTAVENMGVLLPLNTTTATTWPTVLLVGRLPLAEFWRSFQKENHFTISGKMTGDKYMHVAD